MSVADKLLKNFQAGTGFQQLLLAAGKKQQNISGLNHLGKSLLLAGLVHSQSKSVVFITKNEPEQYKLQNLLAKLFNVSARIYPHLRADSFNRQEFIDNFRTRSELIEKLHSDSGVTLFVGQNLIEPLTLPGQGFEVAIGQEIQPHELISELINLGYDRQAKAFQPGEIAARGEIVDIFSIDAEQPVRVVFGPKGIDHIFDFNPVDGARLGDAPKVIIASMKTQPFAPTLSEFLHDHKSDFVILIDFADEIFQSLYEIYVASENTQLVNLNKAIDGLPFLRLEELPQDGKKTISFDFASPNLYASQMDKLTGDIKKYLEQDWQVVISSDKDASLKQIFAEAELSLDHNPSLISYVPGCAGISKESKLAVISDEEIFTITNQINTKTSHKQQRVFMADIARSDFIVHTDHGIGKLLDIEKMTVGGVEREYLILEYAKGDRLYVPVDQIDKISKYISADGTEPQLTRLSSQTWKRVVAKIKKESHKFAKELLDLYAKRQLKQGINFNSDEIWEKALSDSFAYKETPDQETVIREILNDMANPKPMDRLLVADVGFGKTEVAIRAAFKAVTSGFQVAVLAPTTILVEQHSKTFNDRLKSFNTRIAALSRFKSKSEQDHIVAQIKLGEIDIAIGTHRLLSKDVRFKNLGLVIIDEEQRFGVTHKEKLKMLRNEVDVLSLTATPIPRTLNLALSGIRDISVIETAPTSRVPILTTVAPYSSEIIAQSIEREIARGGQVYFIHNRVQTIDTAQHKLEQLLPKVRFVHAHGQMTERLLARIMQDFNQHKYDVLIASTIIENGIDNPNVNTLIVDDAGHFGLSQLHQLRGRVGRGKDQGYSYFLYNKGKLSPKGLERLKTIQDNTDLGSGYNIAMRDLQIRGAGGVLSKQQHGHITAIGLSLYTKLVNKAIEEMRTGQKIDVSEVTIDLPVSAFLPIKYVEAESQRLKIYQTLGVIESQDGLDEEFKKIEENFGKPPAEVENLKKLLDLKLVALKTQVITSISARNIHPANVAPNYQITIMLTTQPTPKLLQPLMTLLPSLQIGEKDIRFNHADLKGEWLEGLKKVVKLLNR